MFTGLKAGYFPSGCFFSVIRQSSTCTAKDPALLEERYKQPGTGNLQRWDEYVVYGLMIGFITWIVIMPLDSQRFGGSPVFPVWVKVLGIAGQAGAFFLFFRSYTDNTFLSPLVRIQGDRRQRVVSTGVYGFVRHPMYLGRIFMFTGAPLLLGSWYGLFVGLPCDRSSYGQDMGSRSDACAGP